MYNVGHIVNPINIRVIPKRKKEKEKEVCFRQSLENLCKREKYNEENPLGSKRLRKRDHGSWIINRLFFTFQA